MSSTESNEKPMRFTQVYPFGTNRDIEVEVGPEGIRLTIVKDDQKGTIEGEMTLDANELGRMVQRKDFFTITSVHRDDVRARGFDADQITDYEMKRLASDMADDYVTQLFHQQIDIIGETMGLPRQKEENS